MERYIVNISTPEGPVIAGTQARNHIQAQERVMSQLPLGACKQAASWTLEEWNAGLPGFLKDLIRVR